MRPKLIAALAVAITAGLVPSARSGVEAVSLGEVPDVGVTLRLDVEAEPARAPTATQRVAAQTPMPDIAPADTQPLGAGIREWHVMYAAAREPSREPASTTPCPRADTCDMHQMRAGRWPTDATGRATIPFAYNDDGRRQARAPQGLLIPALRAAMAEWSHWNSNIVFQDAGTTTARFGADGQDGSCDDGTNVVTWERFDRDVIGAALLCFDDSGKVIRDADLALNATQHWEAVSGEPDSRHAHDIQSILTHELGHWLGLEDLYAGQAARQTMYGSAEYGETRKRTLALGDALGIQEAYPCGSGDRCPGEGFKQD